MNLKQIFAKANKLFKEPESTGFKRLHEREDLILEQTLKESKRAGDPEIKIGLKSDGFRVKINF